MIDLLATIAFASVVVKLLDHGEVAASANIGCGRCRSRTFEWLRAGRELTIEK